MAKQRHEQQQPTEVSVNLNAMREQVMRGFIDANRATLKVFEDIDAAERVLAAHATGTFPHDLLTYHAGAGTQPMFAPGPMSSNGNGKRPGKLARPPLQLKGEVERPNKGGQGSHIHPKGTGAAIIAHALARLGAMAPGERLTVPMIFEGIVAAGILPPTTKSTLKIRQGISNMMRSARKKGQVEILHAGRGPHKHAEYVLAGRKHAPGPAPAPAAAAPAAAAPAAAAIELGAPIPPETKLREAVIEVMLRSGVEMKQSEITGQLLAHGWPKKRGKGVLSDHVVQMMIDLRRKGIVNKRKVGNGFSAPNYYSLRRPSHMTRLIKL